MAEVVASSSQPALGAIRLAWWREALERLDTSPPPPEPRLKAAASELLPRGVTGKDLAKLEAGWAELLVEQPDPDKALQRGATLFGLGAKLLNAESPALSAAGCLFAAGDLRRRAMEVRGASILPDLPKFERRLRPLTALAALARRDLFRSEPEATPGRAFTLIRHRLTGRIG